MPGTHRPTTTIRLVALLLFFATTGASIGQQTAVQQTNTVVPWSKSIPYYSQDKDFNLFGVGTKFIQNIGQYGETIRGHEQMGKVLYGYEGLSLPVLFTANGIIYLHRKLKPFDREDWDEMEANNELNKEIDEEKFYDDRYITLQWVGANPNPAIIASEMADHYYTYRTVTGKARGYKKITYRNLYNGIDLVYSFNNAGRAGFEYSLIVHPGADVTAVRFKTGGDVVAMNRLPDGTIAIASDLDTIVHSMPVTFYKDNGKPIGSSFIEKNGEAGFSLGDYDKSKTIVIDPFVSSTSSLPGPSAGIAKDIDFDYAGNVYVVGGGSASVTMLAKFDKDGNLLWTFNGSLTSPMWNFGFAYGGWVVEKISGKTYIGQGGAGRSRVIRLTAQGAYDNYITDSDPLVEENWKMIWSCDGGTPKMFIAGGGGGGHNINLGICSPPSTTVTPLNLTGQPTGHQDMADMVIDPKTNDMYMIFAQGFITPITENNKMYKHSPPYSVGTLRWGRMSGYTSLNERNNRPYLGVGSENSVNTLAVNKDYLFYYDGLNLKAMNKANGNDVGTAIMLPSTLLMQGGIIADECNNVYVGSINGTIKVYRFNGSTFDDAAVADIKIAGFPSASVYDLAFDNGKHLLYACGAGFVAAIDIKANCAAGIFSVNVNTSCGSLSATATLNPAAPSGSTVTYVLYEGSTVVTTNGTGVFNRLSRTGRYTVQTRIDEACGGTHASADFDLSRCSSGGPGKPGIYVPTAFTPNGDGLNDLLKAIPFDVELKKFTVYSRWGEIVFTTTDPDKGWDGRVNGVKQPTGVYVWYAEGINFDNEPVTVKGTTTLIR